MNFIVKRQYLGLGLQLRRLHTRPLNSEQNKYLFMNCTKNLKGFQNINGIQTKRTYFTATFNILLFSQIGPFVGLILGKVCQHYWPQYKPLDKIPLFQRLAQNKFKILSFFSVLTALSYLYYERNKTQTPITKRQRFILFDNKSYEEISHILFKVLYKTHKHKILGINHKSTKKVNKIVKRLLESNKEFDEIRLKDWKVFVIDDRSVANAFVLPTGQIFVYTGIIRQCDNESQLATILAHELSHTLMGHGNEVLSNEVFADFIETIIVFLLWFKLPSISALFGTIITSLTLKGLLVLPKRRLIETEADFIGLILSAKTCYDVREGSAFWMKMASTERPRLTYKWSTHPSNTSRYETMDAYMDAMIRIMQVFKCDDLPQTDPRHRLRRQLDNDDRTIFSKNDEED